MTLLEICQIAAGLAGWTLASAEGQTGDNLRMVNWVKEAWLDIQTRRNDWKWMRLSNAFTTSAAKGTYTPTEIGIVATLDRYYMERVTFYRLSDGQTTERPLNVMSYEDWFQRWGYGSYDDNTPADVTISEPGSTMILSPTPDDQYRVRFEYHSLPSVLALNADTPEMPSKHHYLLVYEALKRYALWDNAPEKLLLAKDQIERYWYALVGDQAPSIVLKSQALTKS